MIEIDCSDFDRYAGDLEAAARSVAEGIPAVVSKGGLNVKKAWNDAFFKSRHFRGVGGTVTYDTTIRAGSVEAEIGPDKDRYPGTPGPGKSARAAAAANLAHFGGANGGGGTVADPQTFLDAEEPNFTSALEQLIVKALS